jgi:hypothetical protein
MKIIVLVRTRTTSGTLSSMLAAYVALMMGFSDYNYVRQGTECIPAGPEPIPADVCKSTSPGEKYQGSSGYRLIPGNTCNRDKGVKKDEKVEKDCSEAQKPAGEVSHQTVFFKRPIVGNWYFKNAKVGLGAFVVLVCDDDLA